MSRKSFSKLRMEIAQEAAKIIAIDGVNDYLLAKKKAAVKLGIHQEKHMPANREIEQALVDYQQLFLSDSHQNLQFLRETAVQAMRFLKPYNPCLTGPVLTGTATQYSAVILHLFCDETEQVAHYLTENCIPFTSDESILRLSSSKTANYPSFHFLAKQTKIVLIIFPLRQRQSAPLSPIDAKPMRRAEIKEVENLL